MIALLDTALVVYSWVIILRALLSWVVPDPGHPVMRPFWILTEPLLAPLRKLVPPRALGGLDISPILALVLIYLLRVLLVGSAVAL
ncbi:MAG: YggT family protein [Thermoanaerobaculia bacterium]